MCLEHAARKVRSIGSGDCCSCAVGCLGRGGDSRHAAKRLMDEEREEGQALLRSMVTSSGSADEVDWAAVIAKANELHSREQEWLRKQDWKDRQLFLQRQRKALQKRKRFDAIGSFSVNLLTYRLIPEHATMLRDDGYEELEDERDKDDRNKSTTSIGSSMTNEGDTASFGSGNMSPGSAHVYACRSGEENLEPIEEQVEVPLDQSSSL